MKMDKTEIIDIAKKAGWQYQRSEPLNMDYAIRTTPAGPEVMTEDRVKYSPDEIRMLSAIGGISPEIHQVKRVFSGRIIAVS